MDGLAVISATDETQNVETIIIIMKNFISIIKFYLLIALLNPFTLAGLISGCHGFTFFGFVVSALACSVFFLGGGVKAFK